VLVGQLVQFQKMLKTPSFSNRIGMKHGMNIPGVNTHRLTELDFRYVVKMEAMRSFLEKPLARHM